MIKAADAAAWWGGLRTRWRLTGAAVSGAVAALGLAPFDLWVIGWLGFAGVLALSSSAPTARAACLCAWLGAAFYFAVTLHWIVEPFLVDAARHGWMAPFALPLMAGGLALFWALPGWLAHHLTTGAGARVFVVGALIVLAEVARATVLTGFPWAHPGHGLIASPLLGLAAWVGPHGLNAVIMGYAALGGWLLLRARLGLGLGLALLPVALLLAGPVSGPAAPDPDRPIVRLVQPNAPQHLKWRDDMIPVFFDRALDLTAMPAEGRAPGLIIWPETTLPVLLGRSEVARARIASAAGGAQVLLGAQRFEGLRPRNSAALLDGAGEIRAVYDKHHLVPFGEYMPGGALADALGLRGIAEVLAGGYSPGPGPRLIEIEDGIGQAYPMICYEAIFPGYLRDVGRPDWLAHLTNDAWFGQFSGPYQHLAIARLRAVEQGVPVLRAANTGVSAVIDARGRIVAALPLNTAGALDAALPVALPPTLYARVGDFPVLIIVLLATFGTVAADRRSRSLRPPV